MNTHQNFSSLLTQSKQLLEATKTEKNNYIARRKSELQISELEDAVLKLKQKKNTLENIEKNKVKLGKLQNENSRIETEIYQVRSSILVEQQLVDDHSTRCKWLQQNLTMAEHELEWNRAEIEKEYSELVHQIEFDRKIKIADLNDKLQKDIDEAINEFKTKLSMV